MRPFSAETIVDLRVPSDVRLALTGATAYFCLAPTGHRDTNPTTTIYTVPTDGATPPRALTDSEHQNTAPRPSPDGTALAFLSDRPKRGEAQLHRIDLAGGEPVRLTELTGGTANPAWRPDGRFIAFTARRRALAGELEPQTDIKVWSEQWRPHMVAMAPALGGAPVVLGPANGHVQQFAWSPDGTRIAAVVSATEDLAAAFTDTHVVLFYPDGTGEERELLSLCGGASSMAWSPDSKTLVVIGAQLPDHSHARVFVIDVASGTVRQATERELSPAWIGYMGHDLVVQSVEGQYTRFDRLTHGAHGEWKPLDLQSRAPGLKEAWLDTPAIAGDVIVFTCAFPDRPAEVYAVRGDGVPKPLTDLHPQLDGVPLATMEAVSWTGTDGLRIEGWLLLPPDRKDRTPLPFVVQIHGGPAGVYGSRFAAGPHNWGQLLATRGYAVLLPNPRGSIGRGEAFTRANRYDLGGQDYADIMAGVELMIARGIADPERMGVCGWSYGGFMTAWTVTQTDRFKAAVAGAPPTNWVSKIGTTDIGPSNAWNSGTVHGEADRVWEKSPIRFVSKVKTPTLLVGGDADKRVPITQAMELHFALRANDVESELVIYPRQKHGFHERIAELDLLNRVTDWFDRLLLTAEA